MPSLLAFISSPNAAPNKFADQPPDSKIPLQIFFRVCDAPEHVWAGFGLNLGRVGVMFMVWNMELVGVRAFLAKWDFFPGLTPEPLNHQPPPGGSSE